MISAPCYVTNIHDPGTQGTIRDAAPSQNDRYGGSSRVQQTNCAGCRLVRGPRPMISLQKGPACRHHVASQALSACINKCHGSMPPFRGLFPPFPRRSYISLSLCVCVLGFPVRFFFSFIATFLVAPSLNVPCSHSTRKMATIHAPDWESGTTPTKPEFSSDRRTTCLTLGVAAASPVNSEFDLSAVSVSASSVMTDNVMPAGREDFYTVRSRQTASS